ALFITFDEAAQGGGAPAIYTVWSGPAAKVGYTSSVSYNHFSHLATVEANWNLPPLNANDSGARNMSEFFVGSQPDFSLSASPWSLSLIAGGSAVSNVSAHPQNGFQGAVTLDATASPVGVTVVCTPSVISAGDSSACAMSSSAAGSFDVTVSGTAGTRVNRVTIHVQVIALLSAQFTFSPSSPFAGEPVDFSASAAGGQSPYDYSWQLGDASTMTGDHVSHVYSSEGVYRVNLTIHDGSGQVATPNTTYFFDAWATGHGFATGGIMSFRTMVLPMLYGTPGATARVEGTLGTNGWYISNVTVTLIASDSLPFVAWIHYVVDDGGWLNYTAPFTLQDGKHNLAFYAFDASRSPPERNHYANVSVDTTPPVVRLEAPARAVTSSFPIRWTGSDAGSGIAGYEIQVDGGPFQTVGFVTNMTLVLADGLHTFAVRATDLAGNADTQTR